MSIKQKFLVIGVSFTAMFLVGSMMLVNYALADSTIEVSWGLDTAQEAEIDFFRIYDMNNDIIADDISKSLRAYDFITADACNSWYMVSVKDYGDGNVESDRTNAAPWCPEAPPSPQPPAPTMGTFTISGSVTITPNE